MPRTEYKTHPSYSPQEVHEFFEDRGWPVKLITKSEVDLTIVAKDAALECGDGRFDNCPGKDINGPRVLGGINAVAAMVTGGTYEGYFKATQLVKEMGYNPGTHSDEGEGNDGEGCGFYLLWLKGKLKSAKYPYEIKTEDITRSGINLGDWLRVNMRLLGGKHFRLNGQHVEEGVRLNPFIGLTEVAQDCKRFRIDDWFLAQLGVTPEQRYLKIAETVEQLKPDAKKMEIIIRG